MKAFVTWFALLFLFTFSTSTFAGEGAADKKTIKHIAKEIELVPSLFAKEEAPQKFKSLPPFSAKKLAEFANDKKHTADKERENWKAHKDNYAKVYPLRAAIFVAAAEMEGLRVLSLPLTLATTSLPREVFQNGRLKLMVIANWQIQCICESPKKPGDLPVHDGLGNRDADALKAKAALLQMQAPPAAAILRMEEVLKQMQDAAEVRNLEKSKRWQADFDFALTRVETNLLFLYEYNYLLGQIRAGQLPQLAKDQEGWKISPRPRITVPESKAKALSKDRLKLLQKIQNDYPETPWAYFAQRESQRELGMQWAAKK